MRVCHGFAATFDDPNLVSCRRNLRISEPAAGFVYAGVLGGSAASILFARPRPAPVPARRLINLAGRAALLPGGAELAYIDVDDTVRQTFDSAKQGAGPGYTRAKGLNTRCSRPFRRRPLRR